MSEPDPKKPFDRRQLAGPIVLAIVVLFGIILFLTREARADEAFIAACMAGDGGSRQTCICLDDVAGKTLSAQMRGYVVLSMSQPQVFAARAQKNELPGIDYRAWTDFTRKGTEQCGYGQ